MQHTSSRFILSLLAVALAMLGSSAQAADKLTVEDVYKAHRDDNAWFATSEAKLIIDSVIAHQISSGGWHKQYDLTAGVPDKPQKEWEGGTIDNYATYTELILLAKAYNATHRRDALASFNKGLDFLLSMQYPNGGFPQRLPLPKDYGKDITFNDHAMTRALGLLHDVAVNPEYAFVDDARRTKAKDAFDRGIDIILKLQIKQDGKLAGWGQQYKADTLEPSKARTYELPSLATDETVGIVRLLMSIEKPSPEVKTAIKSAVEWLEKSKLTGIRLEKKPDSSLPKGYDVFVVEDSSAPPIWARFYEIATNRPFFCGRDGVTKYKLEEIEAERRSGYAWLRPYAANLPTEYAKWAKEHGE